MKKGIPFRTIIPVAIPLILLAIFTLCIVFPDYVPMLQIHQKSYPGIGSETVTLKGEKGKGRTMRFVMKRVPAGVAPSECTDVPGGTVVKEPFMIAETEVTVGLWDRVVAYAAGKGYAFDRPAVAASNSRFPVEKVSWRNAVVWCNALSEALSLDPVYYADAGYAVPIRSVSALASLADEPFIRPDSRGFRLPSSMEWELAARYVDGERWSRGGCPSGSESLYFDGSLAAGYAVFLRDGPEPVRSKASNRLGIYDMSGSVWEWCFDRFSLSTEDELAHVKRVVRGGSWSSNAYRLQIGGRFGTLPDAVERGQGFRVARSGW